MSEYIKLDDTVYVVANFYHPVSGFSYPTDTTPRWLVYESGATLMLEGNLTAKSNIVGAYWGNFVASTANGFETGQFYDVQISGVVAGVGGFSPAKQFVLGDIYDVNTVQVSGEYVRVDNVSTVDVNIVQVSGVPIGIEAVVDANIVQVSGQPISPEAVIDANVVQVSGLYISPKSTYDANVTQVSGINVSINDFKTDISALDADIYFAHIKYVFDLTNSQDEFAVQWFKNDQPISSGSLTNPRLSVYNTSTGTAIVNGVAMTYASPNLGVVRYNTPSVLASGEPYLIETSGTIDALTRTWKTIVGIDLL